MCDMILPKETQNDDDDDEAINGLKKEVFR